MLDWLKEKLIGAFAPKYIRTGVRAALLILGTWLKTHGANESEIDAIIPILGDSIAGLLIASISVIWSLFDKAKNQPVEVPKGTKVVEVVVAPKSSELPKATGPVFAPVER